MVLACDPLADLGTECVFPYRKRKLLPRVLVYDKGAGGLGLCGQAPTVAHALLARAADAVASCGCDDGCLACVMSLKCGENNIAVDKAAANRVLQALLAKATTTTVPTV